MDDVNELKAGDPCPVCKGEFVVDERQAPDTLIDRKKRNAAIPAAAARFAEQTREKAEKFGVIHRCVSCGYRARFHPAAPAADADGSKKTTRGKAA